MTAHVVSGLLPDISISKDGRWSVESVSNFLVLNVSIYDGGLLFFDGHLILNRKAVLFTLDDSLEALHLQRVLVCSRQRGLMIGVGGQYVDEGLVEVDVLTYFVINLVVGREAIMDVGA